MLEQLRARARFLAIPAQLLAVLLTLVQALLWVPMWAALLLLVDDVYFVSFGRGIGWGHWIALWVTAGLRVAIWVIRDLLDLDLSDNSGGAPS
jgi:hypothetical protein